MSVLISLPHEVQEIMAAGYFLTLLRTWGYFRHPDVTRCPWCHRLPVPLILRKINVYLLSCLISLVWNLLNHLSSLFKPHSLFAVGKTGFDKSAGDVAWGSRGSMLELGLFLAMHMCSAEVWCLSLWLAFSNAIGTHVTDCVGHCVFTCTLYNNRGLCSKLWLLICNQSVFLSWCNLCCVVYGGFIDRRLATKPSVR